MMMAFKKSGLGLFRNGSRNSPISVYIYNVIYIYIYFLLFSFCRYVFSVAKMFEEKHPSENEVALGASIYVFII